MSRLLVVTTVHQPDDARIRTKLIPSLEADWEVTYATRRPGPADRRGLTWWPLEGGRLRRLLTASRVMLSRRWDLVALHDPELLVAGVVRAVLGRRTLFDVHEDIPAQVRHKEWVPRALRPVAAAGAAAMLRVAEATMSLTLAEPGYRRLFRRPHPVVANLLPVKGVPEPRADGRFLAYLGDVTEARGAFLAVEAAAGAELPLLLVGRCLPGLACRLAERAEALGVPLELVGPLPHRQALERVAGAAAGLSPLLDLPNYRHSLPTKVLEYLALGIPVLASRLPGTMDVLGDLAGVMGVEPGDPAAWRAAGKAVAADSHLRRRAAAQAAEVRARFSWSDAEVRDVYRAAVRPGTPIPTPDA